MKLPINKKESSLSRSGGLTLHWKEFILSVTDSSSLSLVTELMKGLVAMVQLSLGKDPFEEASVFLFCNKRKDSIKVLRFDKNGFVLAHKKLLLWYTFLKEKMREKEWIYKRK